MENSMPQFSVIVPVYKAERYIAQCIESVLKQTFSDFELILVDDGSPDKSGEICDSYAKMDSRIHVLHKKNGGVTAARGDGLRIATGDYVLFLDSDDYYTPDLLGAVKTNIDLYAPEMVAFGYTRFFENRTVVVKNRYTAGMYIGDQLEEIRHYLVYDPTLPSMNFSGIIYGLSAKAIKRAYLLQYWDRVPVEIKIGEDLAMTVLLIKHCESLSILDHVGYCYRDTPGSAVHSFHADDTEDACLLVAFLDVNLGEESKNSIDVYCLNRCYNHLVVAAKQFESCGEYITYVKSTYEAKLYSRVRTAKVYLPTAKDRIKMFLMKHRMYRLMYWFYHK